MNDIKTMLSKNNTTSPGEFFGKLFQSRDMMHLMHLNTQSYAQHIALDTYYSDIVGLLDGLIESYQGCYGLVTITIPSSSVTEPVKYLEGLKIYVEGAQQGFQKSFHKNTIDEILDLITSTIYKLKFLK